MICSIFLRGINTGKLKLLNEDFSRILNQEGCSNVITIQAAGTSVFEVQQTDMELIQQTIENALSDFLDKEISSVIRKKDQIESIVEQVLPIKSTDEFHDYIMLTDDPDLFAEVVEAHKHIPYSNGERLLNQEGYFIWTVQKGSTLDDFGSKVLGSKKFKTRLTSRNFNTIEKVAVAMGKIDIKM